MAEERKKPQPEELMRLVRQRSADRGTTGGPPPQVESEEHEPPSGQTEKEKDRQPGRAQADEPIAVEFASMKVTLSADTIDAVRRYCRRNKVHPGWVVSKALGAMMKDPDHEDGFR